MGCCTEQVEVKNVPPHGVIPASSRKCRDTYCALLFAIFWIGMIVIAVVGLMHGEPKRLLYGSDYNGTTCGTGKHKDNPLTFYPRITQDLLEQSSNPSLSFKDFSFYGLCVASCPKSGTYICNDEIEAEIQSDSSLLTDEEREKERKKRASSLLVLPSKKLCWLVALPSEQVFYRCLQSAELNTTSVEKCVVPGDMPEYYDNVNGVLIPNDKCEVKHVIKTSETVQPAQENPLYSTLQTIGATIGRIIGDLQDTWPVFLLCGGVFALILSFVYVILLRFCAGPIVWITMWSFVVLLFLFALMLSTKGGLIGNSDLKAFTSKIALATATAGVDSSEMTDTTFVLPQTLQVSKDKQKAYAVAAYVTYALASVAFLLVCFFQKKIRLAVGIVKEASRALQRLPFLVLFPIVPIVMLLILFAYATIVGAFIYSSGEMELASLAGELADQAGQSVPTNVTTILTRVKSDQTMQLLVAYHFFGFLWTAQLINAISMCTIAGSVCRYYWSRNKTSDEMGRFPVLTSFKNCFRYHFGSLAFGAFIIAVVQFIRAVLLYIDHQTKDLQESNLFLKVVMKIVQCCLWCLEKCLRFLSKNAYIFIAMKGHSFCVSTKDAFKVLLLNVAQVGVVSTVTFLLLGAGKVAIALSCAIVTFVYLEKNTDDYGIGGAHELSSPLAPILVAFLLGWFVASTCLDVYEMAIDTILLCFCEDKELNKATGQYIMGESLKKFVASIPVTNKTGSRDSPNVDEDIKP
ncbi:choline transporter-like protein [Plasmopara halstedii]|uniref:Choline transporter-like protein n=1 Tax=Plasmopara halstedii TaxID=4781 RepID=A0A0P1A669_PLAHL|nr:choline transporter-like protein [Plasmopara halstedii]CEG35527.1 choline transporter-like protein [Plasmopara halstedii]|eukprot:XP_024571896.1 choline transporter-like protein [Plasmopara halstedii]